MDIATIQANGLHLEVAVCGNGPPFALCLHGFPEHWISWRHQLPWLTGKGV